MAGIYVSGGTFSGSGDVTTDWFVCDGVTTNTVYLPDGVLDCTGEDDSNYSFELSTNSYLYNNSGTVRISNPADSYIYMYGKSGSDRYV